MEYFDKQQSDQLTLAFNQIEEIIGEPLCSSARKYSAYWYPSKTHTITRCWIENGFTVTKVDIKAEIITFEKS